MTSADESEYKTFYIVKYQLCVVNDNDNIGYCCCFVAFSSLTPSLSLLLALPRSTCVLVELSELNQPIRIHMQMHECEASNEYRLISRSRKFTEIVNVPLLLMNRSFTFFPFQFFHISIDCYILRIIFITIAM